MAAAINRDDFLEMLRVGDRRALGKSTYVADLVRRRPSLARHLIAVLFEEDTVARAHAAHALMEVTMTNPEFIRLHRKALLSEISQINQWEVCEQLCKVLPRLHLGPKERNQAAAIFVRYTAHRSSIVRACALQGLADLAMIDPKRERETLKLIEAVGKTGTAAVRARARKLAEQLNRMGNP